MSHVDEGTIHAWLDGALDPGDPEGAALEAHLRECEECRDRVEAERRVRARASDVLEQVRPASIHVEPFEKVLAARRAAAGTGAAASGMEMEVAPPTAGEAGTGATPDIAPRRSFRFPIAIAATVTLAITATWMARRIGEPVQSRPTMEADAAAAPEPEGLRMNRVTAPARNAPTIGAPPQEQKVSAEREAAFADRQAAATVAGDSGPDRRLQAATEQPPPVVGIAEPPQRSGAETRRIDSTARVAGAASAVGRNERAADQDLAAAGQLSEAVADPFTSQILATSGEWRITDAAEAARRLGRAPASIEGLPVDSLQEATIAGRAVIRLLQTAASGERIELFQWTPLPAAQAAADERPKAAAPVPAPEAAARRDSRATVASYRFTVPGVAVLIRAALPADSLAALAGRARQ